MSIERTEKHGYVHLESEIMGSWNHVYVHPNFAQMSLSEGYGRQNLQEALKGIDDLIALLQAAKDEILAQQNNNGEVLS